MNHHNDLTKSDSCVTFILSSTSGVVLMTSLSHEVDQDVFNSQARVVAKLAGTMHGLSSRVTSFELSVSSQVYFVLPLSVTLPFLLILSCDQYGITKLLLIALQIRHILCLFLWSQLESFAASLAERDATQLHSSTFHDVAGGAQNEIELETELNQLLDMINVHYIHPLLSADIRHNWSNPVRQQLTHLNTTSCRFLLLFRSAYGGYERIVPLDERGAVYVPCEWEQHMNACDASGEEWLTFSEHDDMVLIISKTNVLNIYLCATLHQNFLTTFSRAWSAMLFRFHQYHPLEPPIEISERSLSALLDVCAPVGTEKGAIAPTAPMAPKKPPRPHARYSSS